MVELALQRALRDATARLAAAGVPSARVDAELLTAHVLGVSRMRLPTVDRLTVVQRTALDVSVDRRVAREPLQHITGLAPFGALELAVGPGVFIPRPETELLAQWAAQATPPGGTVIDLCSGSGAVALFVANEVPTAAVIAVELDPAAAQYLRRNVAGTTVQVVAGDATDPAVARSLRKPDVLVANPPYVPSGATLPAEVAGFDPPLALFAGEDGLETIRGIVDVWWPVLAPGAAVGFEHDDTNGAGVVAILAERGARDIVGHTDLAGRDRFVTARVP